MTETTPETPDTVPEETATRSYLTKAQLQTAKLACKLAGSPLGNLRVTETETAISDGLVLLVAKHRQPIPGLEPFSIASADALALAKIAAKPSKYEGGPYATETKIEIDLKATLSNGHVRAVGTSTIEVPKASNDQYPDYARYFPTDEPDFSFKVNAKLFAELLLQVAQFADERYHAVHIHLRKNPHSDDPCRMIELTTGETDSEQVRALIMPLRITPAPKSDVTHV